MVSILQTHFVLLIIEGVVFALVFSCSLALVLVNQRRDSVANAVRDLGELFKKRGHFGAFLRKFTNRGFACALGQRPLTFVVCFFTS